MFYQIEPQVVSSQLPSLACVIDKYWIKHGETRIEEILWNVRVIKRNLWLCHKKGITVLDATLRQLRLLQMSDCAKNVALMADGKLAVATTKGLCEANEDGEYIYLQIYFQFHISMPETI